MLNQKLWQEFFVWYERRHREHKATSVCSDIYTWGTKCPHARTLLYADVDKHLDKMHEVAQSHPLGKQVSHMSLPASYLRNAELFKVPQVLREDRDYQAIRFEFVRQRAEGVPITTLLWGILE